MKKYYCALFFCFCFFIFNTLIASAYSSGGDRFKIDLRGTRHTQQNLSSPRQDSSLPKRVTVHVRSRNTHNGVKLRGSRPRSKTVSGPERREVLSPRRNSQDSSKPGKPPRKVSLTLTSPKPSPRNFLNPVPSRTPSPIRLNNRLTQQPQQQRASLRRTVTPRTNLAVSRDHSPPRESLTENHFSSVIVENLYKDRIGQWLPLGRCRPGYIPDPKSPAEGKETFLPLKLEQQQLEWKEEVQQFLSLEIGGEIFKELYRNNSNLAEECWLFFLSYFDNPLAERLVDFNIDDQGILKFTQVGQAFKKKYGSQLAESQSIDLDVEIIQWMLHEKALQLAHYCEYLPDQGMKFVEGTVSSNEDSSDVSDDISEERSDEPLLSTLGDTSGDHSDENSSDIADQNWENFFLPLSSVFEQIHQWCNQTWFLAQELNRALKNNHTKK